MMEYSKQQFLAGRTCMSGQKLLIIHFSKNGRIFQPLSVTQWVYRPVFYELLMEVLSDNRHVCRRRKSHKNGRLFYDLLIINSLEHQAEVSLFGCKIAWVL